MSDIYAKPDLSRKVRYDKKAEWEDVCIYESTDNIDVNQTISTPQKEEQQSQCRPAVRKCPVRSSSLLKGLLCSVTLAGIVIMTLYLTVEIKELNNSYNQLLDNFLAVNNSQLEEMKQLKNKIEVHNETLRQNHNQLMDELKKLNKVIQGKWCPDRWTRFGCSCYYKSTESKTWSESRKDCQNKGADLVIINSDEEQEFVAGLSQNEDCWIGLRAEWRGQAYVWKWVDESSLTRTYWDLRFTGGYYATCCSDQGKWKKNSYSEYTKYTKWICEK